MAYQRPERVGRQVLHEVSRIVEQELADPRLRLLTFTDVRMSVDLSQARIYYSVLGCEEQRSACKQALAHASGYLRREISRRLGLRRTPLLAFEYDDSLERAERISRLLAEGRGPRSDDET